MTSSAPDGGSGKVEAKTWASTWATFVAGTVLLSFLGTISTDYFSSWPDWLEVPAYSAVVSLSAFVAGYLKAHKPSALSISAIQAVTRRR